MIAHVSATGAASYPQSKVAGAQYARLFRVRFALSRNKKSLLAAPLEWDALPGQGTELPATLTTQPGDDVVASLLASNGGPWRQVGTELRVTLREGAPLTFGRALGLGAEELNHGSEWNRVLTAEELRVISFN